MQSSHPARQNFSTACMCNAELANYSSLFPSLVKRCLVVTDLKLSVFVLLIVCVSSPVDTAGTAELIGTGVTGASVVSSCFSSADIRKQCQAQ